MMKTVLSAGNRSGIVRVTSVLAISFCFASNLHAGVDPFIGPNLVADPGLGNMGTVTGTVTPAGNDQFLYEYSVANDPDSEEAINGFLLPFFDDAETAFSSGVKLTTPAGWMVALADTEGSTWSYDPIDDPLSDTYGIDPGSFVNPPYVLHFFTTGIGDPCDLYACLPKINADDALNAAGPAPIGEIFPGESLGGFSFVSDYGSGGAPLNIEFAGGIIIVDPPIPVTPSHPAFNAAAVPEPAAFALSALALLSLGFVGWRHGRR